MVRRTDHLNMTIAIDWDLKHQTKQTKYVVGTRKNYLNEMGFFLAFKTYMFMLNALKIFTFLHSDLKI